MDLVAPEDEQVTTGVFFFRGRLPRRGSLWPCTRDGESKLALLVVVVVAAVWLVVVVERVEGDEGGDFVDCCECCSCFFVGTLHVVVLELLVFSPRRCCDWDCNNGSDCVLLLEPPLLRDKSARMLRAFCFNRFRAALALPFAAVDDELRLLLLLRALTGDDVATASIAVMDCRVGDNGEGGTT